MKRVLLFLLFPLLVFGQTKEIDSLKKVVSSSIPIKDKVDAYSGLFDYYIDSDLKAADQITKKLESYSEADWAHFQALSDCQISIHDELVSRLPLGERFQVFLPIVLHFGHRYEIPPPGNDKVVFDTETVQFFYDFTYFGTGASASYRYEMKYHFELESAHARNLDTL